MVPVTSFLGRQGSSNFVPSSLYYNTWSALPFTSKRERKAREKNKDERGDGTILAEAAEQEGRVGLRRRQEFEEMEQRRLWR